MTDRIAYLGLLDEEAIILDAAALDIAALDHPDVDLDPYASFLANIAEQLLAIGAAAATARSRADALSAVIGGDLGFAGDRTDYGDPANADLIRVIDRRRGLPVSLSILYVAAARRAGWEADALTTPGHVLVRVGGAEDAVLVDPFNGGSMVGARALSALTGTAPAPEHLAPMPNRMVLVRLLMNQATRAEAGGDPQRALLLYRRMTVIAPGHGRGWWERARLELVEGRLAEARASLGAMLEITRDPALRSQVSAALDALAGG